jgi:site-specific DNA-cytosine methylase
MKVLSLFDGISCGMLALQRAGIPVECYDAFEIDKYAVTVLYFKTAEMLSGASVLRNGCCLKHL